MKQFFKMAAAKDVGRVDIYDEIGFWGTSAALFNQQWKSLEESSKRIDVHISSPGGNLMDALTIFNLIQQSKVSVDMYCDGFAASCASLLMMAGRKSHMADNALMMLHNPYTATVGDVHEHQSAIHALGAATDAIVTAYANKSGKTPDEIRAILDAETWYGAQEAKDAGFVDKVIKAVPMAARFDMTAYGYSVPDSLRGRIVAEEPGVPAQRKGASTMPDPNVQPDTPKPASIPEIKSACDGCDNDFVVAQIEASATIAQAQSAWTKVLAARAKDTADKLAAAEREKSELQAKIDAAQQRTGHDPVGAGGAAPKTEAPTNPIEVWNAAVAEKVKAGMTKAKAISALVREDADLHKAYLAAVNGK